MADNYRKRGSGLFIFIVYVIFAVYFINFPFQFIKIPEDISGIIDVWIIFFGGVLLLFGGINYFRVRRRY